MITAAVFPGQGSQKIGMATDLYQKYDIVKELFKQADDALGFSLTDKIFNGTDEELKATKYAQPTLLLVSYSYYKVLEAEKGYRPSLMAGHSLGEYSALTAANALNFTDAIKLVHLRGTLMGEATEQNPGSMAAVIGATDEEVIALCGEASKDGEIVVPANFNSKGQTVISGTTNGVQKLREKAKEMGKKVLPLPVSGSFHSPLMQSAADKFADELDAVEIKPPTIMVIQNVTATEAVNPDNIRQNLKDQITGSVQWVKSIDRMDSVGVKEYTEVGPGNVLCGLIARIIDTEGKSLKSVTDLGY